MSNRALNWAFEVSLRAIDGVSAMAQRMVLVALADMADKQHGCCHPAMPTLCKRACATDRTVQRALAVLMKQELIYVERRWADRGDCTSNCYRLAIDPPCPDFQLPLEIGGPPPSTLRDPPVQVTGNPSLEPRKEEESSTLPPRGGDDDSDLSKTAFGQAYAAIPKWQRFTKEQRDAMTPRQRVFNIGVPRFADKFAMTESLVRQIAARELKDANNDRVVEQTMRQTIDDAVRVDKPIAYFRTVIRTLLDPQPERMAGGLS